MEFRKSLSPEKLFLNRYPDLKADYLPVARNLISHGEPTLPWSRSVNDFLSIRYIFNHYFDELSVVQRLIDNNIILSFANDRRLISSFSPTGSLRQQHGKELVEPIARCLNAFSNNQSITRYFITLLGIIASEQRDFPAVLSLIATQVTSVLQHTNLLSLLVALAHQWTDEYTRLLFLFLCSLFTNGCYTLLPFP